VTRFVLTALGALAGLFTLPALADLPFPASAMLAVALCTVYGLSRGWALANRFEADRWGARRCWEILRDDRNPIGMQERAAARLARLGRGIVADPSGWWPWRSSWRGHPSCSACKLWGGKPGVEFGCDKCAPRSTWQVSAYPFNGIEP
jgi:hypothetical protein